MADPKWTPGPWDVGVGGVVANNRTILCANGPAFDDGEQMVATLRLAAAAPDLYEALDQFVAAFERVTLVWPDQFDYAVYARAVAALGKARGVINEVGR